ncbi:MAG: hypothetical protein KBT85_09400 [Pseudomonas sp.]|nr:hypothetical protein [Pseudomonas sp.]MBQ0778133.1 hypothetical protein [Pseudomonas sp.]
MQTELLKQLFDPNWISFPASAKAMLSATLLGLLAALEVGTLLSGTMAGAVSGWVFGFFCLAGILFGFKVRQGLQWT